MRRRRGRGFASSLIKGRPVGAQVASPSVALASAGDVRIERSGNQRWLVVNRPQTSSGTRAGFLAGKRVCLALDQRDLGIMETDWAENRAKIPQDTHPFHAGQVNRLLLYLQPSATSSAPVWSATPKAAPRSTSATAGMAEQFT